MLEKAKGNTFANTVKIPNESANDVASIVETILLDAGLHYVRVGSSINNAPFINDIDIQVELSDVVNKFNPILTKKSSIEKLARIALKDHFQNCGFDVAQSGINIFLCVPFNGNFHQVDLEVIYHINDIKEFHIHNIPNASKYKGVHKQLLIALLAKKKGYLYSAWEGLYKRTSENKKGEFVTRSFSEISNLLIGKFGSENLNCVENILSSLPYDYVCMLLSEVEQDKNWIL